MPIYKGFMVKVLSELPAEEAGHKKEMKRNLAKLPSGKLQQPPLCIINSCRSQSTAHLFSYQVENIYYMHHENGEDI